MAVSTLPAVASRVPVRFCVAGSPLVNVGEDEMVTMSVPIAAREERAMSWCFGVLVFWVCRFSP